MSREILNSSYAFIIEFCEERNLNLEDFFKGTSLDLEEIKNYTHRSDYANYPIVFKNIEKLVSPEDLDDLFLGTLMSNEHSYMRHIFNGVFAPELLYWSYAKFLGSHFISIYKFHYKKLSATHLQMRVTCPDEYEVHPLCYVVYEHLFRFAPQIIGHKESKVSVDYQGHTAIYNIELQQVDKLSTKFFRAFKIPLFFKSWVRLLENVVSERYERERAHQELEKKSREIEKIAQDNVLFTRFLVHDLKNSLFVANHYVKKSKEVCANNGIETRNFEKAQMAIDTVIETLERAKELEATEVKDRVNFDNFNLVEAINEAIDNMYFMANEKAISINLIHPESDFIEIRSDRMLLIRSVLENLLTNAIKFSFDEGEINIRLELKESSVSISIEDQGIGIPEHFLDHLFETSEKTVGIGTHGERGTGFGLLIVKKVLNQLGGSISVSSIHKDCGIGEHGTCFKIELPLS